MKKYLDQGFYLAGFLSYETGYALDETFGRDDFSSSYPLLWFGVFEKPRKVPAMPPPACNEYYVSEPHLAATLTDYRKTIAKIKNLIARGESYQINYTSKFLFEFSRQRF